MTKDATLLWLFPILFLFFLHRRRDEPYKIYKKSLQQYTYTAMQTYRCRGGMDDAGKPWEEKMSVQPPNPKSLMREDTPTNEKLFPIDDVMCAKFHDKFPSFDVQKTDAGNAVFAYKRNKQRNVEEEYAIIRVDEGLALIVMNKNMAGKELTENALRILNHMNCTRFLVSHEVNVRKRIYQCKCTIPLYKLTEDFDSSIKFVQQEYEKAKCLLHLECK